MKPIALLLPALMLVSAQSQAPDTVIRINVNLVQVDAVVVDDLGLSFDSIARLRSTLKKYVDTQMQPGDLVAVIRTGAGMGSLQQFTSDKRLLYAAIDQVKYNALGRVGASSFTPLAGGDD